MAASAAYAPRRVGGDPQSRVLGGLLGIGLNGQTLGRLRGCRNGARIGLTWLQAAEELIQMRRGRVGLASSDAWFRRFLLFISHSNHPAYAPF